jgi:sugar (pentulose or hexulose) kinase
MHVAIDLGAGSGRALLGQVDDAGLSLREVHRFTYGPRPPEIEDLRGLVGRLEAALA